MGSNLDGISSTGGDSSTGERSVVDKLIEETDEVDSKEELRKYLQEIELLSGISTDVRDQQEVRELQETVEQETRERQREDILQQQLEELENVGSEVELLKNVAARLSTTNNILEDVITEINSIELDEVDISALDIKDANHFKFDEADRDRELVDEDDIVTNSIVVKAPSTNMGKLWIGSDGTRVGRGFVVEPGEVRPFQFDVSSVELRVSAEEEGDEYSYIAKGPLR